jgi:hypothetical protein
MWADKGRGAFKREKCGGHRGAGVMASVLWDNPGNYFWLNKLFGKFLMFTWQYMGQILSSVLSA